MAAERKLAGRLLQARKAAGAQGADLRSPDRDARYSRSGADAAASNGLRVAILGSNIDPRKREEWIAKRANTIDVLICNPRLVETGLDLVQFSTVIFFEIEYSALHALAKCPPGMAVGADPTGQSDLLGLLLGDVCFPA